MTIKELLRKYNKVINKNPPFKAEYLFKLGVYEVFTNEAENIYSYCYDGRRGIWINIFKENKKLKCIQVNAGREGDDACATICIDKDWLNQLAKNKGTILDLENEFSGKVLYVDSIDKDISAFVIQVIGGYGTNYKDSKDKILEVLEIKERL